LEKLEGENQSLDDSSCLMQSREEKDEDEDKELSDKFAQTFYKYMHNLSNRKFIDVINTPVDHEDRSLIFYQ